MQDVRYATPKGVATTGWEPLFWSHKIYCCSSEVWPTIEKELVKTRHRLHLEGGCSHELCCTDSLSTCPHCTRDCPFLFLPNRPGWPSAFPGNTSATQNVKREMETKLDDHLLYSPTFIEHRCSFVLTTEMSFLGWSQHCTALWELYLCAIPLRPLLSSRKHLPLLYRRFSSLWCCWETVGSSAGGDEWEVSLSLEMPP